MKTLGLKVLLESRNIDHTKGSKKNSSNILEKKAAAPNQNGQLT
jgi:hypothetical protein